MDALHPSDAVSVGEQRPEQEPFGNPDCMQSHGLPPLSRRKCFNASDPETKLCNASCQEELTKVPLQFRDGSDVVRVMSLAHRLHGWPLERGWPRLKLWPQGQRVAILVQSGVKSHSVLLRFGLGVQFCSGSPASTVFPLFRLPVRVTAKRRDGACHSLEGFENSA